MLPPIKGGRLDHPLQNRGDAFRGRGDLLLKAASLLWNAANLLQNAASLLWNGANLLHNAAILLWNATILLQTAMTPKARPAELQPRTEQPHSGGMKSPKLSLLD